MNTLEAIQERRSIRHFNERELDKEIINDLLNCGRLAPSAKNRQPWFFIVIKNEIKDKIADIMIEKSKLINSNDYQNKMKCESSVLYTANVIKEANVLVLVFREKDDNWIIGDNLSIGACVENILLRATELKIGSLWIRDTVHAQKEIEGMFNYDKLELNSAIALGYTDIWPKARHRKELKNITVYYE